MFNDSINVYITLLLYYNRIMHTSSTTQPASQPNQPSKADKARLLEVEAKLREEIQALNTKNAEVSLADFTKQAWHLIEPETKLVWNWHIDVICAYLEATLPKFNPNEEEAKLDVPKLNRLIINVPPGSLKSILVSVMFPAWLWIHYPGGRVLGIANIQDLSIRDARKTKIIVESEWYQERWPLELQADQKAKTNYENSKAGFRGSLGLTGNITGKRGDYLLIDDPHDAVTVQSDVQRQTVLETYDSKVSTRVNSQDRSVIIIIMQRLHHMDLTGHLLAKTKTKWVHVVIPMHFDPAFTYNIVRDIGPHKKALNDPRKDNDLLFPQIFSKEVVGKLYEDLGEYHSAGQLEQKPSPKSGGILRQEWFRVLPDDSELPLVEHVFCSWDTAYSERDMINNSYSACTTWGVFWNKAQQRDCMILLNVWFDRVDYPTLRKKAADLDTDKKPDTHLIEKKASGLALVQDLRRSGLLVREYTPTTDKVSRAYAIQPMLESGQVWIPDRKWAKHFAYLMGTFPTGVNESEDLADTFTQAALYIRNGFYVTHPDDIELEVKHDTSHLSPYGGHMAELEDSSDSRHKGLVHDSFVD